MCNVAPARWAFGRQDWAGTVGLLGADVAAATEREHPDLAFVGLGRSGEHALEMISEIVREACCPVIALLEAGDPNWVNEAAKRGIFAYIVDGDPDEMQSAIDVT